MDMNSCVDMIPPVVSCVLLLHGFFLAVMHPLVLQYMWMTISGKCLLLMDGTGSHILRGIGEVIYWGYCCSFSVGVSSHT